MSCGRGSPCPPASPQNGCRMDNVTNWLSHLPPNQADMAILNSTLGSSLSGFNSSPGGGGRCGGGASSPSSSSNADRSRSSSLCRRCEAEIAAAENNGGLDGISSPSMNSSNGPCSPHQSPGQNNVCGNQQISPCGVAQGQQFQTPNREEQGQQPGLTPMMNACFGNFSPDSDSSNRLDAIPPPAFNPSPISERQPCAGSEWASSVESSPVSIDQPNYPSFISSSTASGSAASPGVCGRPATQSRPGTPCSVPGPCSPCTPPQQRPVCGDNFNMNMSGSDGLSGVGAPSLNSSANSGQWAAGFNRAYYQTTGQGLGSVGAPSFNSNMSSGMASRPGTPCSVPGPCSPGTPPQPRPFCGDNLSMNMSGSHGISGIGTPSLNSSYNSGQWGADFNRQYYQTTGQGLGSVGAPSFNCSSMASRPGTPTFHSQPAASPVVCARPVTPMGLNVAANFSPQAMSCGAGQAGCCSSCGQSPNMNVQLNYTPPLNTSWNPPHVSTPIGGYLDMGSPNAVGIGECSPPSLNQSINSGGCAGIPSPILEMGSPNAAGINECNPPNFNSSSSSGGSGGMQMVPPASGCSRQQNTVNFSNGSAPMASPASGCSRQQNTGNFSNGGAAMASPNCGNFGIQALDNSMNTSNGSSRFEPSRVCTPCGERLDNMSGSTGINDITYPSSINSSGYSNPVCGDNLNLSGDQGMGISQQTPPGYNSCSNSGSSNNNAPCPRNQNFENNIGPPMYNSTAINDPAAQPCPCIPSPVCGNTGVQAMTHSMNTSNTSSGLEPPRVCTPCGERLDNMSGSTGIGDISYPSSINSSGCSNPVCGDNLNLSGDQGTGISQQTPPGFNSFSSSGSSSNGAPCQRNIDPQGMSNALQVIDRPENAPIRQFLQQNPRLALAALMQLQRGPPSPGGCDGRRIPSPHSILCLKNQLYRITGDRCPCLPTDPNFVNCLGRVVMGFNVAMAQFIQEQTSRASAGNQNTGQNMQTGQGCGGGYQNMLPCRQLPALPAPPSPPPPSSSSGSSGGVGACLASALEAIPEPSPCSGSSKKDSSQNCACGVERTNESKEDDGGFPPPTAGGMSDGIGGPKVKASPTISKYKKTDDGLGDRKVKPLQEE